VEPLILLGERRFAESARAELERVGRVEPFADALLPEADALVVGLELRLDRPLLERGERLRAIATRTSQLRHIDLDYAAERGIKVLSIDPAAPLLRETSSTAEETWALLLALVRNVPWAFDSVKEERWERARYGGHELQGKTLGVIGYGRLGSMVARYGRAFGMTVLATDPKLAPGERVDEVEGVSLDDLLARADVVSLHCTFNDATTGLLGEAEFARMKPGAFFVNTARGEISDEAALLRALEDGRLAGAAIDTLAGEGPQGEHLPGNPLVAYARDHESLIVVPHLGGATAEATERTQLFIVRRLVEFLEG
jgi:D-3-phosphoglycerate dehydrogenase